LQQGALASPTNWHSAEFGILSDSAEARDLLLESLFDGRPRRVALGFLDSDQASLLRNAAVAHGYRIIHRTLQRSPYVLIDGRWADYEHFLDSKMLRDLRRRERLLASRGKVSFEVEKGERLEGLLQEGFEVEASGWKGGHGTAIRSEPSTLRFYTEVARWAAARGWLRLCFLRVDGRAVAFDYAFEHEGAHYLLKTGYDVSLRELGPGKLLRHQMLARTFRLGLRSYEFLGTDDAWKLEWAQTTRPRELVQSFRPSPLGVIDWSVYEFGRPFVKRVRHLARKGLLGDGTRARHEAHARTHGEASG
jgi:hypothetical protein